MRGRTTLLLAMLIAATLGGYFAGSLLLPNDDGARLPGRHEACERCHTPSGEAPHAACLECHDASLATAEEPHPEGELEGPRHAARTASHDARACVLCHREHTAHRTHAGGVTFPLHLCGLCHQDIARRLPSHQGFTFDGCVRAGCHRFHDDPGKHLLELVARPAPTVAAVVRAAATKPARVSRPLRADEADAPAPAQTPAAVREWLSTSHAKAGVNCSACHDVRDAATGVVEWRERPGNVSCGGCHGDQEQGFLHGRHGVRTSVGLSPLTPERARRSMKGGARGHALGCDACHSAHAYDTTRAALEACVGCHDDRHTRAYFATRHARAWDKEQSREAPAGTGVSCATCHLPRKTRRVRGVDELRVEHDVSAPLRPRDKMARAVCLPCHELEFSIDALADDDLVARNFNGRPAAPSLEMVEPRGRADREDRESARGGAAPR